MYGALIVEDTKEKYDKDYTLMLDEWVTDKEEINKQVKEMTKGKKKKQLVKNLVWIMTTQKE